MPFLDRDCKNLGRRTHRCEVLSQRGTHSRTLKILVRHDTDGPEEIAEITEGGVDLLQTVDKIRVMGDWVLSDE